MFKYSLLLFQLLTISVPAFSKLQHGILRFSSSSAFSGAMVKSSELLSIVFDCSPNWLFYLQGKTENSKCFHSSLLLYVCWKTAWKTEMETTEDVQAKSSANNIFPWSPVPLIRNGILIPLPLFSSSLTRWSPSLPSRITSPSLPVHLTLPPLSSQSCSINHHQLPPIFSTSPFLLMSKAVSSVYPAPTLHFLRTIQLFSLLQSQICI